MIVLEDGDSLGAVAGTASAITVTVTGVSVTVATGAETFGKLYQGQIPDSAAALFTVGTGLAYIVKTLMLNNPTGSIVTGIQLYVDGTADSNSIIGPFQLGAGCTATLSDNGWSVTNSDGEIQTSGSGGGSPGGSPGQVQYNNSGAFGGFTVAGDGTLDTSTGDITITKTSGVAFATSATTDTTDAANITSGTLPAAQLPNTTVTPGSYTATDLTVDATGRITAASNGSSGGGTVTSVALTAPAWLTVAGSPITSSGTLAVTGTSESANQVLSSPNGSSGAMTPRALVAADLPDTAVTPGSYTSTDLTVDAQGRITAASNGSGGGGITALTGDVTASGSGSVAATLEVITIGFTINDGAVAAVAAWALAPRTATYITKCKVLTIASDASTGLAFKIKQNGTDIFSSDPTVAAGTSTNTVSTFTTLTSSPLPVTADDVFILDITGGTSSWQFTTQLE